jgi:hypothetical protein
VNRDSGTGSANGGWLRRLVRHRGHLLSGFEQHFSAANQSIGPTKNALPVKYKPRPTDKTLSLPVAWQRNQTPALKQNRKARTAATRDNIFIVLCCLLCGANDA